MSGGDDLFRGELNAPLNPDGKQTWLKACQCIDQEALGFLVGAASDRESYAINPQPLSGQVVKKAWVRRR